MEKTKKLPISVSFEDYKTKSSEFLIPSLDNEPIMIGITTGRKYKFGAISYIGVEIDIRDIIDKLKKNGIHLPNEEEYIIKMNCYIKQLYNFKISNVIECISNKENVVILNKVANRPRIEIE